MDDLDSLGARHRELLAELDELKPKLHAAIRKARAANMTQSEIMRRSGYKTVQQIRVITGEASKVSPT
jgi:hypothetical protein